MFRYPLGIAALFALSACGQQTDDSQSPAQASAAAQAAAEKLRPEPGKYRLTSKVTKVTIPGLPPEVSAQAGKMFASTGHQAEFCLTPEQANMGYEEMTKRAAQGKCTYERFTLNGGQIDAAMTCETGRGAAVKSRISGTVSPTGMNLTTASDAIDPGQPGRGMKLEGTMVTERIGDCP